MTEQFALSENSFKTAKADVATIAQESPWLRHAQLELSRQQLKKSERDNTTSPTDLAIDTGYSLAYTGVQSWITSLGQIADDLSGSESKIADAVSILPRPDEAEYRSNRWYAQQLGNGVGFFVPFAITHAGLKTSGLSMAARTEQTIASTGKLMSTANGIRLADGAITGFVADFALRPLEGHETNHVLARTKNGITGAAVMTTMSAGSLALGQAGRGMTAALLGEGALKQTGRIAFDSAKGFASGIPGGAVAAETHSLLHEGRFATSEELTKAVYTTAWTGGALGGAHVLARDPRIGTVTPNKPESNYSSISKWERIRFYGKRDTLFEKTVGTMSDYHSRAKWALRDGVTDARQATYGFLNRNDMRHPIQRLTDAVRGPAPEAPRVKLTAENNPVKKFEAELPKFIEAIEAKERLMESKSDRREQYEVFKEMGQVRTDFAVKLLEIWNGTPNSPGMKSYSDVELAYGTVTAGRVAQIREAITQPAKSEHYLGSSKLTESLLALSKREVEGQPDHFNLLGEIEFAKERYYGYKSDDLIKTMQMPRQHAIKDHEGDTPVDWFPNVRDPRVADLYHGTVSGSLSSILVERALLPPKELQIRGIKQTTGESANETLHRQNISITRDFNEAYAYNRHSPAYLTGFPVIFGISRDIAPRTRLAGMLERGELLVPKLSLGTTLGSRMGLTTQDITHMFVPDAEVPNLQNLLQHKRIKGVNVVGFNQMTKPEWIVEAPPKYDEFGFKIND